jgi:hypothetical protein
MMDASPLTFFSASQLMTAPLPPRPFILDPVLPLGSLGLIYGPPGVGKSFLALAIAWAAASGGSILGWKAARPHRVLYLEGEMGALEMRERVALFGASPPSLSFSLAEQNGGPVLDLARIEGLERLRRNWNDPELLVVDNVASLSGLVGGDPDRWHEQRRFLLSERRAGRSVLLVDHTNRDGARRGSSRRDDIQDLVIALRRPRNWRPADGARCEFRFEKMRSRHGPAFEPRVAQFRGEAGGTAQWHWQSTRSPRLDRAVALLRQGIAAEAMARELGMSPRSAYRLQSRARAQGWLAADHATDHATHHAGGAK